MSSNINKRFQPIIYLVIKIHSQIEFIGSIVFANSLISTITSIGRIYIILSRFISTTELCYCFSITHMIVQAQLMKINIRIKHRIGSHTITINISLSIVR